MKIKSVSFYKLDLPFRLSFAHAQKKARCAKNIVVEILSADGALMGYGEGGPRSYVTGETQESAVCAIETLCQSSLFPWEIDSVEQVSSFIDGVTNGKARNSALCALEIALLDLLGRHEGRNMSEYLPGRGFAGELVYGAIIPIGNKKQILAFCKMIKDYGIRRVRVKFGRDFEQNQAAIKIVQENLKMVDGLRVDVNGAWDLGMCEKHLPLLELHGVSVLEQPMLPQSSDWNLVSDMCRDRNIRLMADESVCSMEDLDFAISEKWFDAVNIRLSKCGGFFNSLKLIDRIREAELEYQVGCQLGESGILSAAGRALCSASFDALYYDGSYDGFLLANNVTTQHVSFRHGGRAIPLEGPGLGVAVDTDRLEQLSEKCLTISRS